MSKSRGESGKACRFAKEDADLSTNPLTVKSREWRETAQYKPSYGDSINRRYGSLMQRVKKRGDDYRMTKDEYVDAVKDGECHWCGDDLPTHSPGLDRIDNSIGYRPDNVVPCCGRCNTERGVLLFDEYEMVLLYRKSKGSSPAEFVKAWEGRGEGQDAKTTVMRDCKAELNTRIEKRAHGIGPSDQPPPYPTASEPLAEWRRTHSITQEQASYWLRTSRRSIQRIEAGGKSWHRSPRDNVGLPRLDKVVGRYYRGITCT